MMAGSRQEAIALTGDDAFYTGSDSLEEDEESSARNSKKGKKKTTKKTSQKITVKKSSTYKGIK